MKFGDHNFYVAKHLGMPESILQIHCAVYQGAFGTLVYAQIFAEGIMDGLNNVTIFNEFGVRVKTYLAKDCGVYAR